MRFSPLLALAAAPVALANPVMPGADPHAAVFGKEFWIYPTESRSPEPLFAAYSSRDLQRWERRGTILKLRDVKWIKDDGAPRHFAWAPGIATKNNRGYFYFSVGPQNPTPSRIGVAVGDRPNGPFVDSGKPLVTGDGGFEAIDPMVFVDKDGAAYLYAGGSAGGKLRVWELEPDMVNLKREVEVATPPEFTEGAFMHERNGIYYLSYSHGGWNDSSYSVHYATAPGPTGPWIYRGCILKSDARHKGPGHHSFIQNPQTKDWFIVYHRWETAEPNGPYRGSRQIAIERVEFGPDGRIKPITMTDGEAPRSVIR